MEILSNLKSDKWVFASTAAVMSINAKQSSVVEIEELKREQREYLNDLTRSPIREIGHQLRKTTWIQHEVETESPSIEQTTVLSL